MTDSFKPAIAHCPNCHFDGDSRLFEADWQARLVNLLYTFPGEGVREVDLCEMTVPDQFDVYLRLKGLAENG